MVSRALTVLATGALTLVQDAGRPGLASVGVGPSGAADRAAYRLGGRLVGHGETRAALEILLGGFAARARGDLLACLTGAPAAASVGGRVVPHAAPFVWGDGEELLVGMPPAGLRTYLSVRGGLAVRPVLGSRATDTLSGLGPPPVRPGDEVPVGVPPLTFPQVDVAPRATVAGGAPTLPGGTPTVPPAVVEVSLLPGPRADWFQDARDSMGRAWTVSSRVDRIGLALEGRGLARTAERLGAELPSEGMVRGAVQVPPSGLPVVLLSDHPVTGGYPVVGVVPSDDVDRLAQARPGERVRVRPVPGPGWPDGG